MNPPDVEPPSELDVVVIGAGVIGLAVARELSLAGREVWVIERERGIGFHTSSRNSEVIHSGIYYPAGSLKASTCVTGRPLLYAYAEAKGIAHKRLGKLIVATSEGQRAILRRYAAQAEANGVRDLQWLERSEVLALEPAIRCDCALFSPSTGIIDSHAYLQSIRLDALTNGAHLLLETEILGGHADGDGIVLHIGGRGGYSRVRAQAVVNAAGLWAPAIASKIDGVRATSIPPAYFAKGHYFALRGNAPFRHLVYPVAVPGGLGTHVTLDLAGNARFGPDVTWIEGIDYAFEADRKEAFVEAIRDYFPEVDPEDLQPAYTGIRPKISPAGSAPQDFVVQGADTHGVPGLVQLYGIESPGLTASLALAKLIRSHFESG